MLLGSAAQHNKQERMLLVLQHEVCLMFCAAWQPPTYIHDREDSIIDDLPILAHTLCELVVVVHPGDITTNLQLLVCCHCGCWLAVRDEQVDQGLV
jgi:hypothetical protein